MKEVELSKQNHPKNGDNRKRIFLAVLGIVFSLAGLLYVFYDFIFGVANLEQQMIQVKASFFNIRIFYLLASFALYWFGVVLVRTLLVKHLLKSVGSIRFLDAFKAIGIGFLANNILPLKAGELARVASISSSSKMRFSSVVGALAFERMLDMIMVVSIAFAAIQVAPVPESIRNGALLWSGLIIGGFLTILLLSKRDWGASVKDKGILIQLVHRFFGRFLTGFAVLKSFKDGILAFGMAILIWFFVLASMWFRFEAFNFTPNISIILVFVTSIGLSVAIPAAPGYIGMYQAAVLLTLGVFGLPTTEVFAFAWLSWFMDMGLSSLIGAICLASQGLSLAELKTPDRKLVEKSTG